MTSSIASSEEIIMIITTSVALIIGIFIYNNNKATNKAVVVPKADSVVHKVEEEDVGSGKVKFTVFFGTQTGTAEAFAKVLINRDLNEP
ncbi:NADPH-cytochrome P450 reductase [Tanacetum coccineum]